MLKVQDSELHVDGYDLCTNVNRCKRGVLIYTATYLKATPCDFSSDFDESIWVGVKLRNKDSLVIGCVYRSPNSDMRNTVELMTNLTNICERNQFTHVLICGDFNLPDIDWVHELSPPNPNSTSYLFVECLPDCFLTQHVMQPTHKRGDQQANILDLILTNEGNMIEDLLYEAPLGKSHHCSLVFKFRCYAEYKSSNVKTFKYAKGDYDKLRALIRECDMSVVEDMPMEEGWRYLEDNITTAMNKSIPKSNRNEGPHNRSNRPMWMNNTALVKVKSKNEAYKCYRNTMDVKEYEKYAKARNQARWECRKAKKIFERTLAKEAKRNPKAIFSYVNSKLKTKTGIADLDIETGKATTDSEKAEALNEFFSDTFTEEDTSNIPSFHTEDIRKPLEELKIAEEKVKERLESLNPHKSPGQDGLHPRVLKELSNEISKPLAIIMQKSLDEHTLPQNWKDAHVSPIFKKGSKSSMTNYRPISLTSVICKQMEAIIKDHLMEYIAENEILTNFQHGFVPGRSRATQLLECVDYWTDMLDQGHSVDTIYLDFAKAFDSVPHERLLEKAKGYGIRGDILQWIRLFIKGRRQRVVVNGKKSSWRDVKSGVPQGSVIGPLLFLLFVNDMPNEIKCNIQLFADDAKIFKTVKNEEDHQDLVKDLDNLENWARLWQMKFNVGKCKVLHLGRRNPRYEYNMGDRTLETAT